MQEAASGKIPPRGYSINDIKSLETKMLRCVFTTFVADFFSKSIAFSTFGCGCTTIDGNVSHHHEPLIDACECASENQNPYQPKAREVGEKISLCQHRTPEDSQPGQTALTFFPFQGKRSEAALLCEAGNNAPVGLEPLQSDGQSPSGATADFPCRKRLLAEGKGRATKDSRRGTNAGQR